MRDPESDEKLLEWFDDVQRWAREELLADPPEAVSYGDSPEQIVDLWRPDRDGSHRLIVSIHGGGFADHYRREIHEPLVRQLVTKGFAVANLEYRRTGSGGGIVETTSDVDAAVDALAGREGIEPGPFAVFGHSSGGYLALWASKRPDVDLAVALAPVTDLVEWVNHDPADAERKLAWAGAAPDEDPDRYRYADLVSRMPTVARIVLMHGDGDTHVPYAHSLRYAELGRNAGELVSLEVFEGEGHFAWLDPRQPASRALQDVLAGPGG